MLPFATPLQRLWLACRRADAGAAWQGSAATVAALLRHPSTPALINALDAHHGSTPLGWCCHGSLHGPRDGDHPGVAQLLLTAGAAPGSFEASDEVESVVTEWTPPSSHGTNGFSSAVGP